VDYDSMIFGTKDVFAVEAILEPGPEFPVVQGNNLAGRIRVWLCGVSVGRFDEPSCWLAPPCQHLVGFTRRLDQLWDASFDALTSQQIFQRLDSVLFGVQAADSTHEGAAEIVDAWRFVFLLHSSEAFDGWKTFLVRPSATTLNALVKVHQTSDFAVFQFPVKAYVDAVDAFAQWFGEQCRQLLPGSPRKLSSTE
jgi:hypothetical protein